MSVAELLCMSERRGGGGGRGGARRRRRARSGREHRRGRKPWESERVQGKVGAMHVALGVDSSSGKQAGGGRARAWARRPHARPPGKGEDDREEPLVGWAGQLQCWAGW